MNGSHDGITSRRWSSIAWQAASAALLSASVGAAQSIEYPSGNTRIEAQLVRPSPDAGGALPAVIVIHDDQGLTDTVSAALRLFADEGFVALAPDLLSRARDQPQPAGRARQAPVAPLSLSQTVEDVTAAFAFLQADSGVDAERISVVGFGWGGWRAYKLAELTPDPVSCRRLLWHHVG